MIRLWAHPDATELVGLLREHFEVRHILSGSHVPVAEFQGHWTHGYGAIRARFGL